MAINNKVIATFLDIPVSFDRICSLYEDFQELFDFAKKIRPHATTLLLGGYEHIKTAKHKFQMLVQYRYNAAKFGQAVVTAVERLNLLFRYMAEDGYDPQQQERTLRQMLVSLLAKLEALLPADGGVQLSLFDGEDYRQDDSSKPCFMGFESWAAGQMRREKVRHAAARFRFNNHLKSHLLLSFNQLSLPLWQAPAPPELLNIPLRQARQLARLLGLPQKQNGRDLSLKQFIDSFSHLWAYNPGKVSSVLAQMA